MMIHQTARAMLAVLALLCRVAANAASASGYLVIADKNGIPCFSLTQEAIAKHPSLDLVEVVSHGKNEGVMWMQYTVQEGRRFEFGTESTCLLYGSSWANVESGSIAGQLYPRTPYFVSLRTSVNKDGKRQATDYFGWFCMSIDPDGRSHVRQVSFDSAAERFRWDLCNPPFSFDVRD